MKWIKLCKDNVQFKIKIKIKKKENLFKKRENIQEFVNWIRKYISVAFNVKSKYVFDF